MTKVIITAIVSIASTWIIQGVRYDAETGERLARIEEKLNNLAPMVIDNDSKEDDRAWQWRAGWTYQDQVNTLFYESLDLPPRMRIPKPIFMRE